MSSKAKYTGILAEPINHRGLAGPLGGLAKSAVDRKKQRYNVALRNRQEALYAHYGISPEERLAKDKLILALAREHVPGFREISIGAKGAGRPKKWDIMRLTELYADVQSLVQQGKNEYEACHVLATSNRFKKRYQDFNHKTLHRRYLDGKKFNPLVFGFGFIPASDSDSNDSDKTLRVIERHALYADITPSNSA